jgi:hypothetical protein
MCERYLFLRDFCCWKFKQIGKKIGFGKENQLSPLCVHTWANGTGYSCSSLNQSIVRITFWTLIFCFNGTLSGFTHFMATLKLGMKQGLQGQTRAQRQVNFKDNSNLVRKPINAQKPHGIELWNAKWFSRDASTKHLLEISGGKWQKGTR